MTEAVELVAIQPRKYVFSGICSACSQNLFKRHVSCINFAGGSKPHPREGSQNPALASYVGSRLQAGMDKSEPTQSILRISTQTLALDSIDISGLLLPLPLTPGSSRRVH